MKKLSMIITACLLAVITAVLSPLTVFAQAAEDDEKDGKYIREVKIGMGEDADTAAAALAGYTILRDGKGNCVDLNMKAGGGWGSKGEKTVYLGYKTTNDPDNAITDLAVMNMKGDYDVAEYDAMFDKYISGQIEPLLDRFIAAIKEYRINFSSDNENNSGKARYAYEALNKFIDDDTGKGLGTLLLNPTKYELGDAAYNNLSDAQKRSTADIVTIFAQANGRATLMIENLIARAADTSDDTWLDRFSMITYDDLIDEICYAKDILPTDAGRELAALYEDDARKIRSMWNDFSARLSEYDEAVDFIDSFDEDEARQKMAELEDFIDNYDEENGSEEELAQAIADQFELLAEITRLQNCVKTAAVYDYLDEIGYGDGTLADFFSRRSGDVNITELYPIAASFSEGQRAGLDFVSLLEMVSIAMTDGESCGEAEIDDLVETSIYEGVDRGIYERGGVALTRGALMENAAELVSDESALSNTTILMAGLSGVSFLVFCGSLAGYIKDYYRWDFIAQDIIPHIKYWQGMETKLATTGVAEYDMNTIIRNKVEWQRELDSINPPNPTCKWMSIGFGIATVVLIGITTYMAYEDLKAYYNVEFTPIPHYIVDEKDITAYNSKGEKIFIKNQSAYYKAVECNRTSADEMYNTLGTCSDLGGDVGRQWLALYAARQDAESSILAESLTAVVGDDMIPVNYTTGVHLFGSGSACNLNNPMFVWEGEAPSVYVYFNVDDKVTRSAAGSVFAGGSVALAAGLGMIVGALAACAVMSAFRKKKDEKETAAA